jgi:hypothetical protein
MFSTQPPVSRIPNRAVIPLSHADVKLAGYMTRWDFGWFMAGPPFATGACELHNLHSDPSSAKPMMEMKSMLADWLIESQDPVLKPLQA